MWLLAAPCLLVARLTPRAMMLRMTATVPSPELATLSHAELKQHVTAMARASPEFAAWLEATEWPVSPLPVLVRRAAGDHDKVLIEVRVRGQPVRTLQRPATEPLARTLGRLGRWPLPRAAADARRHVPVRRRRVYGV